MKTRSKFIHVVMLSVLLLAAFPVVGAAAKPKVPKADKKVTFCHRKGKGAGGYVRITVSKKAAKAHLKHGDGYPGQAVPGQEGKWFDQSCGVVEAVHEVSETQNLESGEWGGVACDTGMTVVAGGYTPVSPPDLVDLVSQAAKPGVDPYPNFSPFTITYPNEGWVVQNNTDPPISISVIVYADCLPTSP